MTREDCRPQSDHTGTWTATEKKGYRRPKRGRHRPERQNGNQLRSDLGKRAPTVLRGMNQSPKARGPRQQEKQGATQQGQRERKDLETPTKNLESSSKQNHQIASRIAVDFVLIAWIIKIETDAITVRIPVPITAEIIDDVRPVRAHIQTRVGHLWPIRPLNPEDPSHLDNLNGNAPATIETAGLSTLRLSAGSSIHPEASTKDQ